MRTQRIIRHKRVRAKINGTASRPRVAIFRSNKYISAQAIDDVSGNTILSVKGPKNKTESVAKEMAKKAKAAEISEIVFDRGGYQYHGHVKAFAEVLRKEGLKF